MGNVPSVLVDAAVQLLTAAANYFSRPPPGPIDIRSRFPQSAVQPGEGGCCCHHRHDTCGGPVHDSRAATPPPKYEDVQETVNNARRRLDIVDHQFNFGFCGHFKTGKSSMINALRGKRNSDPGAAKVNVVECTSEIAKYTCDKALSKVNLFDIPGSGTMAFPVEQYFIDNALMAFDCLIVMMQASLGQDEVAFARLCKKYGQPVVFLRSKCDVDLRSQLDDGHIPEISAATAKQLVETLNATHREKVNGVASDLKDVPFFCVSNKAVYSLITNSNAGDTVFFQEVQLLDKLREISAKGRQH